MTGSAAMLVEAIHSLVDTCNQVLASRMPTSITSCSLWPRSSREPRGGSRSAPSAKRKGEAGYVEAFRKSKDPPTFMVLFEDSAALIGIGLAFLGTWAASTFQLPALDGTASILIGLVLGGIAAILASETKSLLIGKTALPEVENSIQSLASNDPDIRKVNGLITVHLASTRIIVALSVEFDDKLNSPAIEDLVERLEERVRAACPQLVALFIKPQKPGRFREQRLVRFGGRARWRRRTRDEAQHSRGPPVARGQGGQRRRDSEQ